MRKTVMVFLKKREVENVVLNKVRKDKGIIYGARAVNRRFGILSRPTEDYDIFSINPKKIANSTQVELDNVVGFDYFYMKPGVHKGTYKVKGNGDDLIRGTKDDEGVADFTKMPRPSPKFDVVNGIRYRKISEEIKAKRMSLRDKNYKFRHDKDRQDLNRIRSMIKASRL